jgi:SAM-dependent methyltransferase
MKMAERRDFIVIAARRRTFNVATSGAVNWERWSPEGAWGAHVCNRTFHDPRFAAEVKTRQSAPMNSRAEEVALFRSHWSLYDAITENNYMFHREIYALVGRELAAGHPNGGAAILDLGCGNTRFLAPYLRATPPRRYVGVDLSATALEEARGYLDGLPGVELRLDDMLHITQSLAESFDFIFSGFAVHHLAAAGKQTLFQACAQRLVPGGKFLLVDVIREEGETRDQCVDAYVHMMRTAWTNVPPELLEQACTHVATYDFPETVSELMRMGENAGFRNCRLLERFGQHAVMVFEG